MMMARRKAVAAEGCVSRISAHDTEACGPTVMLLLLLLLSDNPLERNARAHLSYAFCVCRACASFLVARPFGRF